MTYRCCVQLVHAQLEVLQARPSTAAAWVGLTTGNLGCARTLLHLLLDCPACACHHDCLASPWPSQSVRGMLVPSPKQFRHACSPVPSHMAQAVWGVRRLTGGCLVG